MEKSERNTLIIKMHNSGDSIKIIADATGMSKGGIHKIITAHLDSARTIVNNLKTTPTIDAGKLFASFVGFVRFSKNIYSNKDTGEIVNIIFVPSNDIAKFGNFVTC
jgi:hypothetical protein